MSPPKRALIAITSAHAPIYEDGEETGLFISEALHPFEVFRKAGFEVDLASETGTYTPDWLSLTDQFLTPADRKVYEDHNSEFRSKLEAAQGVVPQRERLWRLLRVRGPRRADRLS